MTTTTVRIKYSAGLGGWVGYDGTDFVVGAHASRKDAEAAARRYVARREGFADLADVLAPQVTGLDDR